MERTFRAEIEELERVKGFVAEELGRWNHDAKAALQIMMAVDELFTNIASYAYNPPGSGTVNVRMDVRKGPPAVAEVVFIDSGTPYNPLSRETPDVTLPAGKRQIGGLGIFLVKKYMDHVSYTYENGRNILTVQKTI